MDTGTQTHLKTLRDLLEYRVRDLRAEMHAASLARDEEALSGDAHEVTDLKDGADEMQRDEVGAQSERLAIEELGRCEAALHRLDTGVYGDCIDCGEPIALSRLMVQPQAERCLECQAAHEHAVG